MYIQNNLKSLLKSKGISQKELALGTGIRPSTISDILKLNRKVINTEHILKIIKFLDIKDLCMIYSIKHESLNDDVSNEIVQNPYAEYSLDDLLRFYKLELKYLEYYQSYENLLIEKSSFVKENINLKETYESIERNRKSTQNTLDNIQSLSSQIMNKLNTVTEKDKLYEVYDLLKTT